MILSTDNYRRIYNQLMDEREKVRYYLLKNEKGIFRKFRETQKTPVWYHDTVTMPKTRNTYLLYYYAMYHREAADNYCWKGAPLLVNDEKGHLVAIMLRKMYETDSDTDETVYFDALQVYSGHFFSRYRERMAMPDSLSTNDIIANFFGRNEGYFARLDYDAIVLEKNRHKGTSAFGIDDGVTLAEELFLPGGLRVVKHNTFLSRRELKDSQDAATPDRDYMRILACLGDGTDFAKKIRKL